jgi:A/G-specific adenine glycosylase
LRNNACDFDLGKGKVTRLRRHVLDWYDLNHRDLPWRRTTDPYRIWLSEVMLQQTQVGTVIPYYDRFLKRFPDLKTLADADLNHVLKAWEGLGYYARARNLKQAASVVSTKHQGRVPDDEDDFRALPGVGDYIGAAVLSIAFRKPVAVVDGNVKRVLARLLLIDEPVNNAKGHKTFSAAADCLLARRKPHLFNQAMMELGALICRPKKPTCKSCPIQRFCKAYNEKQIDSFPRRIQNAKVPLYPIAAGVVCKKNRFLITRRKPDGLLGGLWEFPGGKILKGETPEAACMREIREEVNLDVEVREQLTTIKHAYTHFKIIMDVFVCRYVKGRIRLNGPDGFRWISIGQTDVYPFPKATLKVLPYLKKKIKD